MYCMKKFLGFIAVSLSGGILLAMFVPAWILLVLLAVIIFFAGLCLIKY